jgi:hypothetical protein
LKDARSKAARLAILVAIDHLVQTDGAAIADMFDPSANAMAVGRQSPAADEADVRTEARLVAARLRAR